MRSGIDSFHIVIRHSPLTSSAPPGEREPGEREPETVGESEHDDAKAPCRRPRA